MALIAAGCAPAGWPSETPTPVVVATAPLVAATPTPSAIVALPTAPPLPTRPVGARLGGTVRVGVVTLPVSLNPLLADDPVARQVAALLYQGLVGVSAERQEPTPALAAGWLASDDARTYTFSLRPNLTWHDGQPVTSGDVAATFGALLAERTLSLQAATLAGLLESVLPLDPTAIRFTLRQPYAPFLTELASLPILPSAHLLPGRGGLDASPAGRSPLGAGPFRLVQRTGDRLMLERFDGFWAGPPLVAGLEVRAVGAVSGLIDGLTQGALDVAELSLGWLTADQRDRLRAVPGLRVSAYPSLALELLVFQLSPVRQPALADVRVRRALAQALDRPGLAGAVTFGQGQLPAGTLPGHSWAAVPQIEPTYDHDLARAGWALDQAGWPRGADGRRQREGVPLTLTIDSSAGNQVRAGLVSALAAAWTGLGIGVTPRQEPFPAFVERVVQQGDFELCVLGIDLGADPDQSLLWESRASRGGYNLNRYSNAQVDRLLASGRATLDRQRRTRLYDDLQRLILTDLPALPLVSPPGLLAIGPRLQQVAPSATDLSHGAAAWWLSG